MPETRLVECLEDVCLIAREIGYPLCVKISSPDIQNPQEIGAVAWDIEKEDDLKKRHQKQYSHAQ